MTDFQDRIDAYRSRMDRTSADAYELTELRKEAKRLRDAIRTLVYANDTEPSEERPVTPEQWERAWEAALDGLRKALEGATL